jgi:RNA polymerase sigma-70 factor (ECF subfamily)
VRRAELRRLRTLLAGLPPRERELIALKYGAGTTNRAIATLTGLSESNVGTILHRTVAALRDAWDEGGRP